jgi:hypothetical protein
MHCLHVAIFCVMKLKGRKVGNLKCRDVHITFHKEPTADLEVTREWRVGINRKMKILNQGSYLRMHFQKSHSLL